MTLSISPCEDNPTCDGVFFVVIASVNGQSLSGVLDVDEFFKSLALPDVDGKATCPESGSTRMQCLPLFTCTCGIFECSGYFVEVTITLESMVWQSVDDPDSTTALQEPWHYAFEWSNIEAIAEELIAAIQNAAKQNPNSAVGCGVLSVDLADRLPYYRTVLERLNAVQIRRSARAGS